ncbi:hypothetical protein [Lactiplantibacillus plantarum]|uniref:hypothetical protein n=1 Tax=Lactiplantibacillus plantarum TaxID=1590 RepID=UPI00193A22F0|nr:hypothetical protein [Lactiplantibacillus plantarum]QRG95880.1 hypothetical protein JNO58_06365 [Lactiplantibacillus plantarum]
MNVVQVDELKIAVKAHNISLFSKRSEFDITSKLVHAFEDAGKRAWKTLNYHDVTGFGNDYCEYYDKKLDNNGCLGIRDDRLVIERPYGSDDKLYQFNKARFETFMYDLHLWEEDE